MKSKKKNYGQWISIAIYMLIGASCGMIGVRFFEQMAEREMSVFEQLCSSLALLILLYLGIFIQIIIHEAGHLVFGLCTGYRFCSFRIMSFMWLKEEDRIHFKRMKIAGTGGQCLMSPPDLIDGNMPVKLYNYGGAIMNLIFSSLFFIVAVLSPAGSLFRLCMILLAIIGTAFALMNGLPLKMSQVNNDGRNAVDLSKDSDAARAFWIQMKVNELAQKNVRTKDMPAEWFDVPSDEAMRNGIVATVGVLACNRLMDEHRFDEADRIMEHLLSIESGIVGLHRDLLINDRIYIALIENADPDTIKNMQSKEFKKTVKAMKDYPSVLRTGYAAALLAENDEKAASEILKKFEKAAVSYPYRSEIQAEKELMDIALNKKEIKK